VPLLSGESCILTSINLHEMYDKKTKDVNWDLLKNVTKTGIRFLDDVTEITEAPLPFIDQITKGLRRLGLGVLGWSDLLVELNIPYDSPKAVELAEKLSWFINFHAWETSIELAKERGSFPLFNKNEVNWHVIQKVFYADHYESTNIPDLWKTGVRNVGVTSIAPTGSIAIIGGVNSSIEPFFALAYKRNITEGVGNIATDSIYETNPALQRKLKEFGYDDEETKMKILNYASENGTLTGCNLVSKEFQDIFKTANEIHWKDHINTQAAWQKYFSNAISKTVNVPEDATVQDIFDIYMYMWKSGLKGGTIYRNNSKSFQILEKPAKKE
jgi:ribonucleoside-diphosphate reductase alpha chain